MKELDSSSRVSENLPHVNHSIALRRMTVKNIYGMDLKQTRRYGGEQSRRVETGLKAGNLVCFVPRGNRSFDKYRALNHNKELSTCVCRNFDAFWFWNHHKS